ncbi:hypothetical protein VTN77DRAFT_2930 [Rasamsonia byssochlamydoides]|uniref:uncharacterized protein n=1 Tax=Rasamsonia byssochlamydoides TaxID=89139 RepID=UPI003743C955
MDFAMGIGFPLSFWCSRDTGLCMSDHVRTSFLFGYSSFFPPPDAKAAAEQKIHVAVPHSVGANGLPEIETAIFAHTGNLGSLRIFNTDVCLHRLHHPSVAQLEFAADVDVKHYPTRSLGLPRIGFCSTIVRR